MTRVSGHFLEEKLKVEDALLQVETRIAQIERKNRDGILKPWDADACADAPEHWGLVQQRLALRSGKPHGRACCADLGLDPLERTEAQKRAVRSARMALTAS